MTREQIILDLQQDYAKRREDNLRLYEQKTEEACQRCPGLRQLLDARHMAVISGVRSTLLNPQKTPGANAGLPSAMAMMNQKIAAALKAGGLPADALQPIYTCSICRDEGYVYTPSRKMCSCMNRELHQRMLGELGLNGGKETFEGFDEALFSSEPDQRGVSQRQMALLARKVCETYADSYPDTECRNLLLTGKSGLGKTYLLHSMARRLAEREVLPAYTSAFHLLEVARKSYIENNSDYLSGFMLAPVLLIDDLGTEPMMQNITVTQLFNLLNERQIAGRHTVISTNLDMAELKERYTERIASRLNDASSWRKLSLVGDDVRKRLKRS
ncbi:MAG: ATP-binding protein [Eubacteriales bacterium]|nr:ATP-binding protein [Eubacteriales bacterium]